MRSENTFEKVIKNDFAINGLIRFRASWRLRARMSLRVSFVICCHNSAKRLPETLRHLAAQKSRPGMEWEVVVVDNASTDDTAAVAEREWARADVSLRVVREPKPGLSHARICGARGAQYEVISYVDDDNWVCADWLNTVVDVFSNDASIGVAGGVSEAVFETPPPAWFEGIQGFFAVGKQHSATGDVTHTSGSILWGAGLTIRREALLRLFDRGFEFYTTGRKGAALSAGEDTELCFALREAGWKLWYDERLQLKHYMTAGRLTWSYALRLFRAMGQASALLELYQSALMRGHFGMQPAWKRTWIFQFLKALKNLAKQFVLHPVACIRQPEGSRRALDFQRLAGNAQSLLAMAGSHGELVRRIHSAEWHDSPRK